jgi:hypothetical protein
MGRDLGPRDEIHRDSLSQIEDLPDSVLTLPLDDRCYRASTLSETFQGVLGLDKRDKVVVGER